MVIAQPILDQKRRDECSCSLTKIKTFTGKINFTKVTNLLIFLAFVWAFHIHRYEAHRSWFQPKGKGTRNTA